ncbi:MAG: trigger factor [Clostridia bacterium]|nr:trigger factor [Clostridia bacterium]
MSTIEKKDKNQVVISLTATKEEFNTALKASYEKNKNKFQVPGFRKGKVPYQLVVKYYGEGVLYDDAIDAIANKSYVEAVKEHNLEVVSRPSLDIQSIDDEGMKYTIEVTVAPEVKLGQYEGVEVPYSVKKITDESVQEELTRMAKRNSSIEEVDRPVENGDTAVIDYEGFKDGVAFEGGKGEAYSLKIGSNSFIPGFEEQLIGHSAGEEFPINVTFPEEYHAEELKGAEVTFNIKIHTVKAENMPAIDDEFAKDVSEFDTLDELKADIRRSQEEKAASNAENVFQNEVIRVVGENAEIDIPECMIDTEVENMVQDQASRMSQQGIELDMYLKYLGQTREEFADSMRPMASMRVRSNLVIKAVSEDLKIEATAEDYDKELQTMADAYKMSKEDIAKALGEDNSFVKESIIGRKTVEYLTSKAVKKEVEYGSEAAEEKKPAKKTTKKSTKKAEEAPAEDATEEKKPAKKTTKKSTKKTEEAPAE